MTDQEIFKNIAAGDFLKAKQTIRGKDRMHITIRWFNFTKLGGR